MHPWFISTGSFKRYSGTGTHSSIGRTGYSEPALGAIIDAEVIVHVLGIAKDVGTVQLSVRAVCETAKVTSGGSDDSSGSRACGGSCGSSGCNGRRSSGFWRNRCSSRGRCGRRRRNSCSIQGIYRSPIISTANIPLDSRTSIRAFRFRREVRARVQGVTGKAFKVICECVESMIIGLSVICTEGFGHVLVVGKVFTVRYRPDTVTFGITAAVGPR